LNGIKKKVLKAPLAIVILIGIVYILGQRTPLFIRHIEQEIKPGQSVEQVIDMLNSAGKKPYLCCWQVQGSKDSICSNPKRCAFPKDQINWNGPEEEIQLSVVFLRQGFLHTDFHVIFDSQGMVASVSEDK
jgi:hypothetical protein